MGVIRNLFRGRVRRDERGDRERHGDHDDDKDCGAQKHDSAASNNMHLVSMHPVNIPPENIHPASMHPLHDIGAKPVPNRCQPTRSPEPAPGRPAQDSTVAVGGNRRRRLVLARIQAREFLHWLQSDEEQVYLHCEMPIFYDHFAQEKQVEPVPWNTLSRHLSPLLRQEGRPLKTYEYHTDWVTKTRKRVRIYVIPKR